MDKIDKRIIYELDKNARIPDTKLAKIVGRSKESVRYRIKKLQEEEIIKGFTIWIDLPRLGYSSAKLYLKISNKPEQKKQMIQELKNEKRLFWLGTADGAWDFGLTYFVKNNNEFFELKNKLFSKYKELILESKTASIVSINYCDRKDLYETDLGWNTMFETQQFIKLDKIETKILKELMKNARVNITEIARKYNVTTDIIRNRIKKMEQEKIILRYKVVTDHHKLGKEFFKTFLYFKNLSKKDETKLIEYTLRQPKIIHFVRQISPWDVELEIMCDNYLEYNKIISNLTEEFSDIINKVETAIMYEDHVFPSKKLIFEE
ncbi:Lrp/AsnC family transcriptional regulator [Candidatus Woesearchaeota archaeon]|nr:Lrp/AsnC family transcriptional regulator [Candidatus Woesearchaeota archaeon]MCF8013298.1 Lrp/AsnC family transcriptional regulator [Candidatus Woesearchaeota archaeon]